MIPRSCDRLPCLRREPKNNLAPMPTSPRIKTMIGVSLVIGLTIAAHYAGFLLSFERFLRGLINPRVGAVYQWTVSINNKTEEFSSVDQLEVAYTAAKNNLVHAQADAVEKQLLTDENNRLRATLHFLEKKPYQVAGADVIARNVEPIGSTIVINQGSAAGIAKGQPVITEGGIFIGKIARAEQTTAVVELVNDGQSRVAATIMNVDHSIGIVEGGYGISVHMTFIPQNETIAVGDTVITSGLEPGIPRGLVIGTVDAVEKEAYQPFQKAVLTTATPLDKIATVVVIVGGVS